MNVSEGPGEVDLRPLSARSVVLSLLLGTHPPELPVRDLLCAVEPLGVAGSTLRAALSRMVAAGDLRSTDAVYRLSDRLLERQRRQDAAVHPETRPWDGDWEMTVVTATGRGPAERAELRGELTALRLAELREESGSARPICYGPAPTNSARSPGTSPPAPRSPPANWPRTSGHLTPGRRRPRPCSTGSPPPPTARPTASPYSPPPYATCSPTRSCPRTPARRLAGPRPAHRVHPPPTGVDRGRAGKPRMTGAAVRSVVRGRFVRPPSPWGAHLYVMSVDAYLQ